jgi:hypothetical protein
MNYYIYKHIRLDSNEVFYVGIGKKPKTSKIYKHKTEYSRAYERTKRHKFWKNITNKVSYRVEIICEANTKKEIEELEKYYIAIYGRRCCDPKGTLVNFQEGGNLNTGPKNKNIKVIQETLEGAELKIWDQIKDIQNELGFLKTNIVKCCRKKQLTAYGYKWRYKDNLEFEEVYPTGARRKSSNNRVGVIITNKLTKEKLTFRTVKEASLFLNKHYATTLKYLHNKIEHKLFKIEYRKWSN